MASAPKGDLNLTVEVEGFNRCLREMQRGLANTATMQQVVDFEVGKIINKAITKTKKATMRSIKRSQEERPPWRTYDLGRGMKKYNLDNRYPNAVWAKIRGRLKETLTRKYQALELARRVWVEVLNKLGQPADTTAQSRIAQSKTFNAAGAAGVERSKTEGKYGVMIENAYGKNRWVDAAQALFAAVVGRRKFFETNVSKGVLRDLKTVAAKYPGIVVKY